MHINANCILERFISTDGTLTLIKKIICWINYLTFSFCFISGNMLKLYKSYTVRFKSVEYFLELLILIFWIFNFKQHNEWSFDICRSRQLYIVCEVPPKSFLSCYGCLFIIHCILYMGWDLYNVYAVAHISNISLQPRISYKQKNRMHHKR